MDKTMSLEHKQGESVEAAFAHPNITEIQTAIMESFAEKSSGSMVEEVTWARIFEGTRSRLKYPPLNTQVSEALNGLIVQLTLNIRLLDHTSGSDGTRLLFARDLRTISDSDDRKLAKKAVMGIFTNGRQVCTSAEIQSGLSVLLFHHLVNPHRELPIVIAEALMELICEKKVMIVSMPDPFGSVIIHKM